MPLYRLYLLDMFSGHINGVEEFHSADDLGAIALATEEAREFPSELWCDGRKVCRFDALPAVAKYAGRTAAPGSAHSAGPLFAGDAGARSPRGEPARLAPDPDRRAMTGRTG